MALTNDQLALARSIYEKYWESYIQGNFEIFCSTLDEDFEMIGTSESEVAHSKSEGIEFYKAQMAEVVGKAEMRNRKISAKPLDDMVLINESCDIYVLAEPEWMFYSKIRISTLLHETNTGWKVIQQHGSLPDMRVQDGETLALEKITRENLELRDAVKRRTVELEQKNRELEIEAALERVRTVAMGMKKPEDMLDVCRIISEQLRQFGVEKIRNIQTAIIDEEKGIYLCYQYFTPYDKEAVERTEYLKSPVEHGMVRQMLASKDGHFTGTLSGRELEEFREHRKAEEHFPDPILDESKEISHCFLSIGEGGLGLTLYQPMDTSTLELFKRFHQVFSLAYSRFQDIQKAETRAREVEIELALERVRAQTMAMHNSEDVGNCVVKMFAELTALGVDEGTRFGIGILNHDNENNQLWTARKDGEEVNMHIGNLDMSWHPLLKSAREAWKAQVPIHKYVLEGEDLLDYYRMLNTAPDYKIQIPIEKLPKKEIQHCFIFEHGFFYAFSPREFQPDLIHITQRFSSLFEQTYRRYLDLVRAEGQAREAEIELALERVRARTMAMHHTEELKEVIQVVFDQFVGLNIHVEHAGFILDYKEREDMHIWLATLQQGVPTEITLPYFDSPHWNSYLEAKARQESFFANLLPFKVKNKFYRDLFEWIPELTEEAQQAIFSKPALAISTVLLDNVGLYIEHYSMTPYTAEENAILMRFGKVFQQTYTRFLDLQKAEAQAKEAQIEAALEKVRSCSLAMHKSSELNEVVMELFERLNDLQIPVTAVGISINIEDSKDLDNYTCGLVESGIAINNYRLPYFDHRIANDFFEAREKQLDFFVGNYSKQEKDSFYEYVINHTELKNELTEDIKQFIFQSPSYSISVVTTKNTMITLNDFEGKSLSDDQIDILKRFAKVFEQAYTRFLDLQKAEAQVREAQIEAGLERVRSRSLAMHKTSELQSVIHTVHHELLNLNISISGGSFIVINNEIDNEIQCWGSGGTADTSDEVHIPRFDKPFYTHLLEGIKNGPGFFTEEYSQDEKIEFFTFLFQHEPWSKLSAEEKNNTLSAPGGYARSCAVAKHTSIFIINHFGERFSEAENAILKRFGKVFEQSYTRFLDLQKAEAQTREAKVEGALEKIRSRTMGMHSSDELPEVANLLFLEVQALGIPAWSCGYNILAEDKTSSTCIMSSKGTLQRPFPLPLTGEASFIDWYHFLLGQEPFFTQELGGKAIEEHYNYMTSLPELKPIFKDIEAAGLSLPTYQINHLCKFTSGFLLFITYEKVPESHDIFKRFTKVFDQTYTRFLDLKKAEAQAREAQIENALEKVRSRSLAMQSPDELIEVVQLLREEMGALGVEELETSSIYIHDDESGATQCWFTIKNSDNTGKAVTDQMTLNLQDTWVGRKMLDFYHSPSNQTSILMHGGQRIEWIRYCEEKTELFGTSNFYGETIPDRTYHLYKFSNGYIGAAAPEEISTESWEVLKRATAVFSFAYTRFRDLQMAEASARVAVRQASLDRVRAEISSMRHANDLDRITPLFFHELTTLGIPFIRCGVFIIQEKQEIVEAYLSSPDGNSLGVLRLPYKASELTYQTVLAWRKGVIYRQHWNKEDFIQWINQLMEEDQIQDSSTYQGSASPPESLDLHFVPFAQGMLYVGSENPLDEKELELVQALAKAFSIAYARYEDFVKLEQAKAEVESAMNELKATQSQLVQQEKLASLGQLTAGIAHEIKNPLNFVNNFSEVSIELVDEAIEERSKGPEARDESLVDEILIDIKSNLKKVHEHGSRANGIVTSMLQHSRGGSGKLDPTDLNALVKEYVNLSFHGMRAGKNPIDVEIDFELDPKIKEVPLIKEDFIRVIINLCNNAFDAMRVKKYEVQSTKYEVEEGNDLDYLPKLVVSTNLENGQVRISIADNGPGIPDEIKDKILQPFFTTKKGTEGTGLGLSITHDIVKAHGGELKVETKEEVGSTFTIILPTTIS